MTDPQTLDEFLGYIRNNPEGTVSIKADFMFKMCRVCAAASNVLDESGLYDLGDLQPFLDTLRKELTWLGIK